MDPTLCGRVAGLPGRGSASWSCPRSGPVRGSRTGRGPPAGRDLGAGSSSTPPPGRAMSGASASSGVLPCGLSVLFGGLRRQHAPAFVHGVIPGASALPPSVAEAPHRPPDGGGAVPGRGMDEGLRRPPGWQRPPPLTTSGGGQGHGPSPERDAPAPPAARVRGGTSSQVWSSRSPGSSATSPVPSPAGPPRRSSSSPRSWSFGLEGC